MKCISLTILFTAIGVVSAQSPTTSPTTVAPTPCNEDIFGTGCTTISAPTSNAPLNSTTLDQATPTMAPTTNPTALVTTSTATPTTSPTETPTPWTCDTVDIGIQGYNQGCSEVLFGETLPLAVVTYFCRTDDFDLHPSTANNDCIAFCLLRSANDLNTICEGCALLPSGDLAYDCRNLPEAADLSCPARDANGVCHGIEEENDNDEDEGHVHWSCTPNIYGNGSFCSSVNPYDPNFQNYNPAFAQDNQVPGTYVAVYCANDIGGFTIADCRDPYCTLQGAREMCNSCQVTEDNTFAYDCSNTSYNLTCAIREADGTCSPIPPDKEIPQQWPRNETFAARTNPTKYSGNGDDDGWGLTLDVSAKTFNVVSDFFSDFTKILIGVSIASLYALMLTLQTRQNRPIPINDLTTCPGDTLGGLQLLKGWGFSLPAVALFVFLLVADFSHSIADIGLDFITVDRKGNASSVVVISSDRRNPQRPMETAGDPITTRNNVFPSTTNIDESRKQAYLVRSYLKAVEDIAGGFSALTNNGNDLEGDYVRTTLSYGGVPDFVSFFEANNGALTSLNNEIPLNCSSSEPMAEFEQVNDGVQPFDAAVRHTAWIPNCTFSGLRESGIYPGPITGSAVILEQASLAGIFTEEMNNRGKEIRLRNGTDFFQEFQVSPASKQLARDRQDWTRGRVISEVDGMMIGNITIDFGRVVIATGPEASGGPSSEDSRRDFNGIVAEIDGECPPRPSGLDSSGTSCVAIVTLLCDSFQEDYVQTQHEYYAPLETPTPCRIVSFNFVWGQDFVADAELVSVIAGIYGFVHPTSARQGLDNFVREGVLAALFALGTVEERASVVQVIRPRINLLYVFFMILPLALSFVLLGVAYRTRQRCLPIPQNVWQLMTLAKDEPMIPRRDYYHPKTPFPPQDDDLVYVFHDARETLEEQPPEPCIVSRQQLERENNEGGQDDLDGVIMVTDVPPPHKNSADHKAWKDETDSGTPSSGSGGGSSSSGNRSSSSSDDESSFI